MRAAKIDANQIMILIDRFAKFGIWKCAMCNNIAPATMHQKRKTYCSKLCMSSGYKLRLSGGGNPNFKGGSIKKCANCSKEYSHYSKIRKFCSKPCHVEFSNKNRVKKVKPKKKRVVKTKLVKVKKEKKVRSSRECLFCKKTFFYSPSQNRIYCSYKCHIDNGGARRAGDAAVKAMKKYGAKKDANHKEIFDVLQKLIPTKDLSAAGFGVPDGIGWVNGGWHLFDVKNPNSGYGRRGLNNRQKEWINNWNGGHVYLLYNIDDALNFAKGDFLKLKRFPEWPEDSKLSLAIN